MKDFLTLKTVDEVLKTLFSLPALESEKKPLRAAVGRYLAKPFYAPENLPGFRRSTMDGYAVRARDVFGASEALPALLQKIGDCPVGKISSLQLGEGQCASIVTGAPLPQGADAVAMVEHSRVVEGGQVEIIRPLAPLENIINEDEDAHKGEELIPAGRKIRAQEIGVFAAFGVAEIEVHRQARVGIISTGDEIAPFENMPKPGQMRDVNSHTISAICRENGASALEMGLVGDDRASLSAMLRKGLGEADVLVVSGGSSAGMRDHTVEAFSSLPESRILVHGVAMSPGKPFILARTDKKSLLGLPGHVASALMSARVFLAPLVRHLQGLRAPLPEAWIDAEMGRPIASKQGRRDYARCRLERRENQFIAWPLMAPSAVLRGMLEADGYVVCAENSEGLAKGQKVKFYPF